MDETIKETAATTELPPEIPPHWFLHLIDRIDRVEANLHLRIDRAETKIDSVEANLRNEITDVRQEVSGIYRWAAGLLVTVLLGFIGVIVTLVITLR